MYERREDLHPYEDNWNIPQGTILQLPCEEALKWIERMLSSSTALKLLHNHFVSKGYTFYLERSKVFVSAARDARNNVTPSVLGILPSFVPVTSVDAGHSAVGISVHHSGYALATSVNVDHKPFGVTEFTLHEIDPATKAITSSTLSADAVVSGSVSELARRLHAPFVPPAEADGTEPKLAGARGKVDAFTVIAPGDQGLLIGAVVHLLLADNYSRALFPPEYARALRMQTPTFQKFAFATRERFKNTMLGVTLSTSSSTSSNICTSTSTSTIEI